MTAGLRYYLEIQLGVYFIGIFCRICFLIINDYPREFKYETYHWDLVGLAINLIMFLWILSFLRY